MFILKHIDIFLIYNTKYNFLKRFLPLMDVEYHRKCFHINLDLIQQKVVYQSLIQDHQQLNQLFKKIIIIITVFNFTSL